MLSIILYALIAVGTSKPIYERYKNTPQIKMTWSLFFLLMMPILFAICGLALGLRCFFKFIRADNDEAAITAASTILAFFIVNLFVVRNKKRAVYQKYIALITFVIIAFAAFYKVYLVIPCLPQKNLWEFFSGWFMRLMMHGVQRLLKNPYLSIFPLFLNWGFSERMDSWRKALYKYLRIMRNSIQSYITSLQEKCHMLNLVNRIEEHKAYQIAVSLFKKGVDPEIIKEVIQENLPNFSDEQLEAAKKEAASK